MRKHGKVDANQGEIVDALRNAGASVQLLSAVGGGCPDLLVAGPNGKHHLLEVKNPNVKPSDRALTIDQVNWIKSWRGKVKIVETPEEALKFIGAVK